MRIIEMTKQSIAHRFDHRQPHEQCARDGGCRIGLLRQRAQALATARPCPSPGPMVPMPMVRPAEIIETAAMMLYRPCFFLCHDVLLSVFGFSGPMAAAM